MQPRSPRILLSAALVLLLGLAVGAPAAQACEKHLNGHQGSSDSQAETNRR